MSPLEAWRYLEDRARHLGIELWALSHYNKDRYSIVLTFSDRTCEVSICALDDAHDRDRFVDNCVFRVDSPTVTANREHQSMSDDGDTAACAQCGAESYSADGTWQPGQWLLFGMLLVCSHECGVRYANENARDGYREGQPLFDLVETAAASNAEPRAKCR